MGNLVSLTYPGGKQVRYDYDAANRLTRVTDWAGRFTFYEYDLNGRLTKTTRPNGTVQTSSYDPAWQLLQQKDIDGKGNVIVQYDYTYDGAGNVTAEQSSAPTQPFNLPAAAMTYTTNNRLVTYNGQLVEYDADGNINKGPLGGVMGNYTFDCRNRLTSAGSTTYRYDAENNRTDIFENGKQTNYLINPNAPLSQVLIKTDEKGSQTFYIYGLGLIGQEEAGGVYRAYHYDRRGSTVALTDINGNVTDRFQYEPYGTMTHRTGDTRTPFLYNGRFGVMTDANGLYHMRARYYNPEIRRFINPDILPGSIDNGQSLNRYAFVNGQPVSFVDPFGLSPNDDDIDRNTYNWINSSRGYITNEDAIQSVPLIEDPMFNGLLMLTGTGGVRLAGKGLEISGRELSGFVKQLLKEEAGFIGKKTSKTFGKPIETSIRGKKVKLRVDAEPDANKIQIQAGSGKDSIVDIRINPNIPLESQIPNNLNLSSGQKQEILRNLQKAVEWLNN